MIRQVCNEVLTSDKGKKKKRAEALKELGDLYKKIAKKAGKDKSGDQFDAFKPSSAASASPRDEKDQK